MATTERSLRPDEPVSTKLSALRDYFVRAKSSTATYGDDSRHSHVAGFSDLLFNRAPASYLNSTSFEALKAVALEVLSFFEQYLSGSKQFDVKVTVKPNPQRESSPQTIITVAVENRPFVVDSILELLQSIGVTVHLLLDPILRDADNRRFCVLYLETSPLPESQLPADLQQSLLAMLSDLLLAVDDFTAMVVHAETAARAFEGSSVPASTASELRRFLHWLCDDNFVFLGYREWKIPAGDGPLAPLRGSDLGLFRSRTAAVRDALELVTADAVAAWRSTEPLAVWKTLVKSPIHRLVRLEFVAVCAPDEYGRASTIKAFVGLFTSKSAAQEASTVPIIRRKVEQLVEQDQRIPHARDYKDIVTFVDSAPKTALLELPLDALRRDIDLCFASRHEQRVRVTTHLDPIHSGVMVFIALPSKLLSSQTVDDIQVAVAQFFSVHPQQCEHRLILDDNGLARIYVDVPPCPPEIVAQETRLLEQKISQTIQRWEERFQQVLIEHLGVSKGMETATRYKHSFPEHYRASYTPQDGAIDVTFIDLLSPANPLELSVQPLDDEGNQQFLDLRLYKLGTPLTLSGILPFLENAGLDIIQETSTRLNLSDRENVSVYSFKVASKFESRIDIERLQAVFVPGLKKVVAGYADNDGLNSLLLEPGIDLRRIAILRVVKHYLWQIKAVATPNTMMLAIKNNPALAGLLVSFFETKFDPSRFHADVEGRRGALDAIRLKFREQLKTVSDLSHDRILRSFLNVIEASVRTNYYLDRENFTLAIKIECQKVLEMPKPRPLYEIFITAPHFEGVHLRGGKVARGGIRWSERPEDFRTEVLGLMKTQMVKNSIIIPTGAKGGFVLKQANPTPEQVKECYEQFVEALLQITDNRTEAGVVHPEQCVIYDDIDPYLVVAADKGTARFSDVANNIATKRFQFWLGDAFASGGSYGYDHKELGITAKGAWETAQRHFREIGIDVATQEFTVVGIGDMSGDVFGNGLLLSSNAKLLAAFNHKHIFIDPNPDSQSSYEERKRLFDLPRSQWSDYNATLLSKGGAIVSRLEKEIALSAEARAALGIEQEVLSGQELVSAILRAPVDLLWNGGIGTYVKASSESHLQVGDRTNDDVRVDAKELRVKVVAEGGNLGFTQLARIEYSKLGGHCNTDAVDNSGGVDCSDYEVNLKILLQAPVRRGALSFEQRNDLLKSLSPEVIRKVTSRNRAQSKVISLGVRRSRKNLDYYRGLIAQLEGEGSLDRAGEYLPDDESLSRRGALKLGMTRPELAILIAYVKNWLTKTVYESNLPEEPFAERFLFNYFPRVVVDRFRDDVKAHPLAREITAKQIANALVERVGVAFVYRIAEETGAKQIDIIAAFLAADAIVLGAGLSRTLDSVDKAGTSQAFLTALLSVNRALDSMTRWLLERKSPQLTWTETVERFQRPMSLLLERTDSVFTGGELRKFEESYNQLVLNGFTPDVARSAASVIYAAVYLDVAEIASRKGVDVIEVGRLYAHLVAEFQVSRLLEQATEIDAVDRWEALSLRTITAQLRSSVAEITESVIQENGEASLSGASRFLELRREPVQRFRNSLREFQNRSVTIPALLVMSNQLVGIAR